MIPAFRSDGFLPEGLHVAAEANVTFRFGSSNARRRMLTVKLRRWVALARQVNGRRLLIDGSFVTNKAEPNDIDAVLYLPADFENQVQRESEPALELEHMLLARHPEEILPQRTKGTGVSGLSSSAERVNLMVAEKALLRLYYDRERSGISESPGRTSCSGSAVGAVAAIAPDRLKGIHEGGHPQADCAIARGNGCLLRKRSGAEARIGVMKKRA